MPCQLLRRILFIPLILCLTYRPVHILSYSLKQRCELFYIPLSVPMRIYLWISSGRQTFWRAQEFQFTMYVPIFQTGSNLQCLVSQRHATTKPRLSPNCSDRCSTQPNMSVFFWSDINELSKRFLNDRVLNKAFIFLTSQWSFIHPLQLAVLCIMCPNFPFLPGCFFKSFFCFVRNTMVLWIFITDGTVFFPNNGN